MLYLILIMLTGRLVWIVMERRKGTEESSQCITETNQIAIIHR